MVKALNAIIFFLNISVLWYQSVVQIRNRIFSDMDLINFCNDLKGSPGVNLQHFIMFLYNLILFFIGQNKVKFDFIFIFSRPLTSSCLCSSSSLVVGFHID